MVARSRKWAWQAVEDSFAVMKYFRRFAVHDPPGADNLAAEDFTDRLVAEADPQDRDLSGKSPDHLAADPRFFG